MKIVLQLYIATLMLFAANFANAGEKSINPVKIAIIGDTVPKGLSNNKKEFLSSNFYFNLYL